MDIRTTREHELVTALCCVETDNYLITGHTASVLHLLSPYSPLTSGKKKGKKKKVPHKTLGLFLLSCLCFCPSQPLHPTSCVCVLLYVVRIHCLLKLEWFDKTREFSVAMIGTHWAQTMSQGLYSRAPLVTARSVTGQVCTVFYQIFGTAAKRKWQSYLSPFLCASQRIGTPT